jgi:hypothetical protein
MPLTRPSIACGVCFVFLSMYFQKKGKANIVAKSIIAKNLAETMFGKKFWI